MRLLSTLLVFVIVGTLTGCSDDSAPVEPVRASEEQKRQQEEQQQKADKEELQYEAEGGRTGTVSAEQIQVSVQERAHRKERARQRR